jgi:hypothetical protein
MTLRASADPSRGGEHLPGGCKDLEPRKESSAHAYEGYEAAPVGLLAFPERPKVCAAALSDVRAET